MLYYSFILNVGKAVIRSSYFNYQIFKEKLTDKIL